MAQKFFDLLNHVFHLMSENKLRKDIDDTLLEKLLTLMEKCKFNPLESVAVITLENNQDMHFDFIEELVKRTEILNLIEKVLSSVAQQDKSYYISIKSFTIRLLGLVFDSYKEHFSLQYLIDLSLFKDKINKVITVHIPSIQDALLFCLSHITKKFTGALWFINENLEEFVFSSFNSSSYYVRKSATSFFINFITQWAFLHKSELQRKPEELNLEKYIKRIMVYIIKHIHFYANSKEIIFAECCVFITKELLKIEHIEIILGDYLNFAKNISECFLSLPEEKGFNDKLIDLFLAIHFKSLLADDVINDVIKYLITKEDLKLSFHLASSFASIAWSKYYNSKEVTFFLLPLYILTNTPLNDCHRFFQVDSDLVYNVMLKKMEDKSNCKVLVCSSFSALQKLVHLLDSSLQKNLGMEILKLVKSSEHPNHKWACSVLEDRGVHHSFLDLFSSFLSEEVHPSLLYEGSDLVFQNIIEILKKPTSDSNFLSQMILLMKNVLILHDKMQFHLREEEKEDMIRVLCRMLLDNRESVIDSAIQLAGQIVSGTAWPSWQEKVSKQNILSIIWDIAIQGSHDGSIRSTALKVIIGGCLEAWCLDEMKSLKDVTENDIVKILFDLTHDPDFFLQREALSCLFHWMKLKEKDLPPSSLEYLFSALVSGIKSLDLELKLISLNVWFWLIEHKFSYSASPTSDIKEYIEGLTTCGFSLSMVLALEDYDEAVQFKAADILIKLKSKLMSNSATVDSLKVSLPVKELEKCHTSDNFHEHFSTEERDEGIDNVMDISTAEQITNICRPLSLSELYDFKNEYFSVDSKDRTCPISLFWKMLWSEKVVSIAQPTKMLADINSDSESLLNDIIAAEVSDFQSEEDTPDCY